MRIICSAIKGRDGLLKSRRTNSCRFIRLFLSRPHQDSNGRDRFENRNSGAKNVFIFQVYRR